MFNLKTFIIFVLYVVVLFFGGRLQQQFATRNNNRPGLILPVVAWAVAVVLSVKNFYIAFDVQFSLVAFLAALALFVFFSVPAMYFSLLYVDGRKEVRARRSARSVRMRQAKMQQRVQPNLQQRYEKPMVKQEPIIYMPNARPQTRNGASAKSSPRSGSASARTSRNRSTGNRNR